MKQMYLQPALQAVEIQQSHIICTSNWDTINPGQPNQPAGAKHYGSDDWDVWNEQDDEE